MRFFSKAKYFFLVCLIFVGCSKTTTFEWDHDRSAILVGIVNDSLAMYVSSRCWQKNVDDPWAISGNSEYSEGCSNMGLHLANFQNKQAPLWGDTLDYGLAFGSQVSDSVMQVSRNGKDGFWKIGGKPNTPKTWTWKLGACSPRMEGNKRLRPWKNGTFIFLGTSIPQSGDSCQYAVLDTATGVILQQRFSGDDAWLAKCEDISFINGKEVCLKKNDIATCRLDLFANRVVSDSLLLDSCGDIYEANWFGHFIKMDIYHLGGDFATYGNPIFKMHSENFDFDMSLPEFKSDRNGWISDRDGKSARYSGNELSSEWE